jgi:hypothetical protein
MKTYDTLFIHFSLKDADSNINNAIIEGITTFNNKYKDEIPQKILLYMNDLTLSYAENTIKFAKDGDFNFPFDHQAFMMIFQIELFYKFNIELYLDGLK